jgi:hypothetical protein
LSPTACPTELAFVHFETNSSPLDTVRLDPDGKAIGEESVSLDRVSFVLSARSDGSMAVIDRIKVE